MSSTIVLKYVPHPYPSHLIHLITYLSYLSHLIHRTPMSTAGLASELRRSSLSTQYWSILLPPLSLSSIPSVAPTWAVTHLMKPVYATVSICLASVDLSLHHHDHHHYDDHHLCETYCCCCCSCQLNAVLHCLYCSTLYVPLYCTYLCTVHNILVRFTL